MKEAHNSLDLDRKLAQTTWWSGQPIVRGEA
jgi:hypothetical protein